MGEVFQKHERGEISDEEFAAELCHELGIALSFEQFSLGWQSVFVGLRPEVIEIFKTLRQQGHRVVVLSNTNRLHLDFWPQNYPEIEANTDAIYLSQNIIKEYGFTGTHAFMGQHMLENARLRFSHADVL